MEPDPREGARSRRGAIAIAAAKGWFLVVGLGQNILVPLAIGQAGFGAYKRAIAFISVVNNVLVVASIQAVSRTIAGTSARRSTMARTTLVHGAIGLALALLFTLSVPLMVAHQHAPQLAPLLHVLAAILFFYGIYSSLVGALNGVHAFGAQAGLDALYSTMRTAGCVGVGWLFAHRLGLDGALGAAVGFLGAAALIVPIAFVATRAVHDVGEGAAFDRRAHLTFLVGLLAMQGFQSLLLQIDLMVLGRAATLRALSEGATEIAAQAAANRVAGLYAQAQAFGLVPYQLLVSAGYVLFPAVAAARARGDDAAVRGEIARGGAATVVVAGALVAAMGGAPLAILRFAFGRGTPDGLPLELAAPILRTLALAHGASAIAALGTTLVAASGRGRLAATLAGVVCFAATVGAIVGGLAPARTLPASVLGSSVALGLAVGIALGAAVVASVIARIVGPYVRLASLLRTLLALSAALAVGSILPVPRARLLAMTMPAVPLLVFVLAVALLGEPVLSLLRGRSGAKSTSANARPSVRA